MKKATTKSKTNKSKTLAALLTVCVVSIIFLMLIIGMLLKSDRPLVGRWDCKYNINDDFTVSLVLDDNNNFRFGSFSGLDMNHYAGSYTSTESDGSFIQGYLSRNADYFDGHPEESFDVSTTKTYLLEFDVKEFIEDGENTDITDQVVPLKEVAVFEKDGKNISFVVSVDNDEWRTYPAIYDSMWCSKRN